MSDNVSDDVSDDVSGGWGELGSVLALTDVSLSRAGRPIVERATFTVARGELVALMGASGSGKTTILRAIAGLDPIGQGSIVVNGVVSSGTDGVKPGSTTARVGLVFQFHCLFEHLTALENVALAPIHVRRVPRSDAERSARALLAGLGVAHRADALPRSLSGGEAQRVAIARALAVDPPLLLMDEPTAALDLERRAELGALLQNLTREGRTVLLATHDADFARDWCGRILRLHAGRIADAVGVD